MQRNQELMKIWKVRAKVLPMVIGSLGAAAAKLEK